MASLNAQERHAYQAAFRRLLESGVEWDRIRQESADILESVRRSRETRHSTSQETEDVFSAVRLEREFQSFDDPSRTSGINLEGLHKGKIIGFSINSTAGRKSYVLDAETGKSLLLATRLPPKSFFETTDGRLFAVCRDEKKIEVFDAKTGDFVGRNSADDISQGILYEKANGLGLIVVNKRNDANGSRLENSVTSFDLSPRRELAPPIDVPVRASYYRSRDGKKVYAYWAATATASRFTVAILEITAKQTSPVRIDLGPPNFHTDRTKDRIRLLEKADGSLVIAFANRSLSLVDVATKVGKDLPTTSPVLDLLLSDHSESQRFIVLDDSGDEVEVIDIEESVIKKYKYADGFFPEGVWNATTIDTRDGKSWLVAQAPRKRGLAVKAIELTSGKTAYSEIPNFSDGRATLSPYATSDGRIEMLSFDSNAFEAFQLYGPLDRSIKNKKGPGR